LASAELRKPQARGQCRQCFLFRQAWYAAHEIVGTPHERGVHGVGGIGELYNRASGY